MKIRTVTLTGADESILPSALGELTARFPFVEWGILVANSRMGTHPRYPGRNWLRLLERVSLPLSVHLCGTWARDLLRGDFTFGNEFPRLIERAQRVQINFSLDRSSVNLPALAAIMRQHAHLSFIIQLHGQNGELLQGLLNSGLQPDCLFDASGGEGIEPKSWPAPLAGVRLVGYAGGLRPELLPQQLPRIAEAAGEATIAIDMESGVRSGPAGETFSFAKCRAALEAAAAFAETPAI